MPDITQAARAAAKEIRVCEGYEASESGLRLESAFADVILKHFAPLLAEREWISVGERLPDSDSGQVLAFDGEICIVSFLGDGLWIDDHAYDIESPTHWMPLPDCPHAKPLPEVPG